MLSYARGPEVPLLECTIYEALVQTAARLRGELAVAMRHQNQRLTWAEFVDQVDAVAESLNAMGCVPGDRIGVWATNCLEWLLLQYACARNGLVQVNVNPAYRSHELEYVIRRSGMKVLFLIPRDKRSNYAAIFAETGATLPAIEIGGEPWTRFITQRRTSSPSAVSNTDIVNIQYTSGTTGSPKGVLLSHRNLLNNAYLLSRQLRLTHKDRICIPVPLYHCFGCVMGSLAGAVTGAALIFPSATFDARATLEAIHEERATAIYGVPTMFIAQLDHPDFDQFDVSSLRTGIMAGAPCPIEVMKQVVDRMHCSELTIAYGQTECSPVITGSNVDDPIELRVSTVGCAMPCTEVKVIDPASGETVPVGEQGELCARGYLVMSGYDQDPEATARALDQEGWLHTGDLARMREDGYFRITGRAKDMIIRGGENIYPREIEEFLHTHPKISDVQVMGLPDSRYGETVAAWIRLKPGESCDEHEIRDYCKNRIAHYKIPQYIRFVEAFPMTVTGKIQKFKMREVEIADRGLETAAKIQTA
jgi:fatty-acyl-CoA synthase